MWRNLKTIILLFIGLVYISGVALSDGVDAGSFVRDGVGARAFGLGGAYVAIADDVSAAVWNPAGLAQLKGLNAGGMYTNKFDSDIYFQSLGATAKVLDFGIGLSMVRSSIEDIPYHGDGEGGYFSETQTLFLGSFSYDLSSVLELQSDLISAFLVGANIKYYSHSLLEGKGSGLGFDLGALLTLSYDWGSLTLGFMSEDVGGTALKWTGTDHNPVNNVPWINKLGVSVDLLEQRLILASGVDFAVGRPQLNRVHLGAEYRPIEQFGVRAGVIIGADGSRQFAAGGSLKWHGLLLDYAYVPHPVLGVSHIISAQFNFPAWWENSDEQDKK